MAKVKKAFQPIIDFLTANKTARVSDILDKAIDLAACATAGKSGSSTVIKDKNGKVRYVYCYYHKLWEDVTKVEYGKKASSTTGLSNMCKEGTSQWTKANAQAKKDRDQLLQDVEQGKVKHTELRKHLDAIEAKRAKISPRGDGHGFKEAPQV